MESVDDQDNNFHFPKEQHLTKRLKDVLESDVDEKYFLSEKMISCFINHEKKHSEKGNGFKFNVSCGNKTAGAVTTRAGSRADDNFIQVKSATKKGYEEAQEGDSINFSVPNSETRRGRVGKGVAQTLDTSCNQGVIEPKILDDYNNKIREDGLCGTITQHCSRSARKNGMKVVTNKIRRLTPRECFRLMDFPDTFKMPCSDTQMYKQAGNSIVVGVLAELIKN